MVIVDTTIWVEYLNGTSTLEVAWFEREAGRQRLGLLDLMVCEILQGLSTDHEATPGVWRRVSDYFGQDGASLVLLLVGGTKATQARDIRRAQDFWRDYLEGK